MRDMRNKIPEFKFKGEPMTERVSQALCNMILSPEKEVPLNESEEMKSDFGRNMIMKRIEHYPLNFMITEAFYALCVETFVDTPGNVMIMLRLCWQYCRDYPGKKILGAIEWGEVFPMGTPSEKELADMWESQKGKDEPLGNMLDNPVYWK